MDKSSTKELDKIKLNYEYTLSLLKQQGDSINRLDTKLSTFLGFGGVLLRFALSLDSQSWLDSGSFHEASRWCLIFKIFTCVFSGMCIVVCAIGLTAKQRGISVDPKELMDDHLFQKKEEICRGYIVSGWIRIKDQFEMLGKRKGRTLNCAIWFTAFSALTFTANIVTSSIFNVMGIK
jgi:hypothetical protein